MKYTTNIGDHLVIWIAGRTATYIAEVTKYVPLEMKVTETGPDARLCAGDYIIKDEESCIAQQDFKNNTCVFLQQYKAKGYPPVQSGLLSLNVLDGKMREILPGVDIELGCSDAE